MRYGGLNYSISKLLRNSRLADNGCWIFHGRIKKDGYGYIYRRAMHIGAHRFAYKYFTGKRVPKGLQIHHTCFNKRCVNVSHMLLVNEAEHRRIHQDWKQIKLGNRLQSGMQSPDCITATTQGNDAVTNQP